MPRTGRCNAFARCARACSNCAGRLRNRASSTQLRWRCYARPRGPRRMQRDQVEPRETAVRALWGAGHGDGAATEPIRLYGAEIFGFLLAQDAGDEHAASDAFSTFCERLWKGLGAFAW